MNAVQSKEAPIKVLALTMREKQVTMLTVNPSDLIFTGIYMEVKDYPMKEFNGEVKAVYTLPILGGAYLKPECQPEEVFELSRRHPGKTFYCKVKAAHFQNKEN